MSAYKKIGYHSKMVVPIERNDCAVLIFKEIWALFTSWTKQLLVISACQRMDFLSAKLYINISAMIATRCL